MVLRDSVIGSSFLGSFNGVIILGNVHKCFSVRCRLSNVDDVLLKFAMLVELPKGRYSSTMCIDLVDEDGLKFDRD